MQVSFEISLDAEPSLSYSTSLSHHTTLHDSENQWRWTIAAHVGSK